MGNCSTTSASFPSETSNIVSRKPSDYDVLKQNWIEAINTGNISGCKFLHAEHASLINEVVDSVRQEKAIHVAARKKISKHYSICWKINVKLIVDQQMVILHYLKQH